MTPLGQFYDDLSQGKLPFPKDRIGKMVAEMFKPSMESIRRTNDLLREQELVDAIDQFAEALKRNLPFLKSNDASGDDKAGSGED